MLQPRSHPKESVQLKKEKSTKSLSMAKQPSIGASSQNQAATGHTISKAGLKMGPGGCQLDQLEIKTEVQAKKALE